MALYDAVGRAFEVPAMRLWGAECVTGFLCLLELLSKSEDWAVRAQQAAGRGYRVYSLNVGLGGIPLSKCLR